MGWPRSGKRTLKDERQISAAASERSRDIYTVSRLNRESRELLERELGAIWIGGELSNFARPRSGHWYFSLKDDAAQVRCAMFRSRNNLVAFEPREGAQLLARARVGMYEPRGEFQLIVEQLELAGEGLLRQKFELLKRKLAAEGLFDSDHKQELPYWPTRIGVVTSPSGAALKDILTVLGRRNATIEVVVFPSAVQGVNAAPEIVNAIRQANANGQCDVLIVGRGGGSIEDLWAFNEEIVARAIFASDIPVVSAVGHEIDFTIADLVADERAATPSASAEICSPDRVEILHTIDDLINRAASALHAQTESLSIQLRHLNARLQHPGRQLEHYHQRLDGLMQRLPLSVATGLELRNRKLDALRARVQSSNPHQRLRLTESRIGDLRRRLIGSTSAKIVTLQSQVDENLRALQAVSPQATLQRGYAIVSNESGEIGRDAKRFTPGEKALAMLARGKLNLTVDTIEIEELPDLNSSKARKG